MAAACHTEPPDQAWIAPPAGISLADELPMTRHGQAGAPRLRWTSLVPILVVLALAFLGSRGLWEPDEGATSRSPARCSSRATT